MTTPEVNPNSDLSTPQPLFAYIATGSAKQSQEENLALTQSLQPYVLQPIPNQNVLFIRELIDLGNKCKNISVTGKTREEIRAILLGKYKEIE